MPIKTINPFVMKNVELIFGAEGATEVVPATDNDYRQAVDQVTLTPSSSGLSWTGLGGNSFTDQATATWTMTAAGAQDWLTAGSLAELLFDHEGERRPYLLRPIAGEGPSFTGIAILTPTQVGGSVNAVAPFSVTIGLTGKPTRVPAV